MLSRTKDGSQDDGDGAEGEGGRLRLSKQTTVGQFQPYAVSCEPDS